MMGSVCGAPNRGVCVCVYVCMRHRVRVHGIRVSACLRAHMRMYVNA